MVTVQATAGAAAAAVLPAEGRAAAAAGADPLQGADGAPGVPEAATHQAGESLANPGTVACSYHPSSFGGFQNGHLGIWPSLQCVLLCVVLVTA